MAAGDHFFVWRRHRGIPFQHHVIDVGDGTVVHFSDGDSGVAGPSGDPSQFAVLRTSIEVVTRDGRDRMHVIEHEKSLAPSEIVERAISQVGRRGYHLIFDNCEHFACWCVLNREESRQVSIAYERATAIGVKAVANTALRAASRLGAKRLVRGTAPWMLLADAAQWATEAGGQHVGIRDPKQRRDAGRAIGAATALGVGTLGGPVGVTLAGGAWLAGEFAGEVSRKAYEHVRLRRATTVKD